MNQRILNYLRITSRLIGGVLFGASLCAVAGPPTMVTGSHHYTRPEEPNGIESLDIQVILRADGTVSGEAHNAFRVGSTLVWHSHLRITCMHFLDEHTVILAGVDVWDSDPAFVGDTVAFIVRDKGDGQGFAPDQRTTVYYETDLEFEVDCEVVLYGIENGLYDFEADLVSAETGNIQIHE